jgi:hypothetical protein
VIFVLLYFTYHSALEAAHVLLAVPFALTGGVYLLWLLGYNFSVAVWVGFIALFGTAVQTAVVMVIYLEDSVERRRAAGAGFSRADLMQAVVDGALLRLRPKLMTVSTVVAGLLPIMWSARTGAEVMKPLATPVLGGMVSSLLHVLIVTPVVFYWLRARELPAETPVEWAMSRKRARGGRRIVIIAGAAAAVSLVVATVWWRSHGSPGEPSDLKAIQTVTSGDLSVALLNASGTFRQGRTDFAVEFRSAKTGRLVDAGTVRVEANMSMPGMPMSGGIEISRTSTPGRYTATGQFGMSGVWKMTVQWDGPAGRGSVPFEGNVQ